jgi:hypothetical protein
MQNAFHVLLQQEEGWSAEAILRWKCLNKHFKEMRKELLRFACVFTQVKWHIKWHNSYFSSNYCFFLCQYVWCPCSFQKALWPSTPIETLFKETLCKHHLPLDDTMAVLWQKVIDLPNCNLHTQIVCITLCPLLFSTACLPLFGILAWFLHQFGILANGNCVLMFTVTVSGIRQTCIQIPVPLLASSQAIDKSIPIW